MKVWKGIQKKLAFAMAMVMAFATLSIGSMVMAATSTPVITGTDASQKETLLPVTFENVGGGVYTWAAQLDVTHIEQRGIMLFVLPESYSTETSMKQSSNYFGGSGLTVYDGRDNGGKIGGNASDKGPAAVCLGFYNSEVRLNDVKISGISFDKSGCAYQIFMELDVVNQEVTVTFMNTTTGAVMKTHTASFNAGAYADYELSETDIPAFIGYCVGNASSMTQDATTLSKWGGADDWVPSLIAPASDAFEEPFTIDDTVSETFIGFLSGAVDATYSVSAGTLPTGLALATDGKLTGTVTTVGDYTFTVEAENEFGTATKEYTIKVAASSKPVVTGGALAKGMVGAAYSAQIKSTGSPTGYALADGTTLPDGLALKADTGEIWGVPTTAGTTNFKVTAENDDGLSDETDMSIEILAKPSNTLNLTQGDNMLIELYGMQPYDPSKQNIYVWTGNLTYTGTETDLATLFLYILPQTWTSPDAPTGNQGPVMLKAGFHPDVINPANQLFRWHRGAGAGDFSAKTWVYNKEYKLEITMNMANSEISMKIFDAETGDLWAQEGAQGYSTLGTSLPFSAANPPKYLGLRQFAGTTTLTDFMPVFWDAYTPPEPVNPDKPYDEPDTTNGDYYIHVAPTAAYQYVTYELNQPLRGTGTSSATNAPTNKLSFDLVVTEKNESGSLFIAFNPADRKVAGGNTRAWTIQLGNDGYYYVSNDRKHAPGETDDNSIQLIKTSQQYSTDPNYPDRVEVEFDFTNYTFDLTVNNTKVSTGNKLTANASSLKPAYSTTKDGEGNDHFTEPDNVGQINVLSTGGGSNKGRMDIRNISAGITNLVDNDTLKTATAANPSTGANGKIYRVGPTEIYQKPQDVTTLLEPGDTVEIAGGTTYPAPLHFLTSYGGTNGTADKPITFKGVGNVKPIIQSIAAINVVMIEADNIVLENLEIAGNARRALAIRGLSTWEQFHSQYGGEPAAQLMTYRSVYYSGGDNLVIRNCTLHDSYQGIHCASAPGDLLVEYCDIYRHGSDGFGHNLYLSSKEGAVHTIQYNYIHDTLVRHNNGLKSRAWRTDVIGNYFYNCDQAMELLSPSTAYTGGQFGEVIGNIIVDCHQGMRLGGDGTGPGSSGRYRVLNNTFVNTRGESVMFTRAFKAIDAIEAYNNVVYATGNIEFYNNQGADWLDGEKYVGAGNWVNNKVGDGASIPAGVTGTVIGTGDPFVNLAGKDFRIDAASTAGATAAAVTPVPATTLENWGTNAKHAEETFLNPTTDIAFLPLNLSTWASGVKTDAGIGAYGVHTVQTTPPDGGNTGNNNNSGDDTSSSGSSGSGSSSGTTTPAPDTALVVVDGNNKVIAPDASGNVTVPAGGASTDLGDDVTVELPAGSVVTKNGTIKVGENGATMGVAGANVDLSGGTVIVPGEGGIVIEGNATVAIGGGVTVVLPEGGSLSGGNAITAGSGGAAVTYPSGVTLFIDEGEIFFIDEDMPLGFVVVPTNRFADIVSSDWYYSDVMFASTYSLFNGTSASTFSPDMPMTRGMLVTVLHRAAGLPSVNTQNPFNDVASGDYFAQGAIWAKAVGITNGVAADMFAPGDNITREQLVTMLMNFAKMLGYNVTVNPRTAAFADAAEVSSWAADAVLWARANGIINGKPGNLFDPAGVATRAEVSAILKRFIELAK